MKTIEVNLIGDLKQKAAPGRKGALPSAVSASDTPQDQKNQMILLGTAGSGIGAVVIFGLIFIILFSISMFVTGDIARLQNEIDEKNIELAKYTKLHKGFLDEKKSLEVRMKVKNFMHKQKFPMGEVLEELRVKVPDDVTLIEVKKAKTGFLIKGEVARSIQEPLRSITYLIINLNTMLPESSVITNAFLASVTGKEFVYEFAIKANVKNKSKVTKQQ